jgi:glucokinase
VNGDGERPRVNGDGARPRVTGDGARPRAEGTLAVIGPGTGLGVAGLLRTPVGWVALPGEGGHASLSAADEFEARLIDHVRHTHAHVSAERLLSGIGLPTLHAAVAALDGAPAPALDATAIVERANAGDARCGRTLDVFCAMLGSFAGNVALTLGAFGGVFVGGGIVPRIEQRFFASRFRERFEAKGRMSVQLAPVPTAVIVDTLAALTGAVAAIEQSLAAPRAGPGPVP